MALGRQDTVSSKEAAFSEFMRQAEPQLRRALVASFGADAGRDATAEALVWGWEHWDRLGAMDNPVGYLFRVGQSEARRRRPPVAYLGSSEALDRVAPPDRQPQPSEPGLASALESLSTRQRQTVLLTQGWGYTFQEAASSLSISRSSVQRHVERGMRRLRTAMGVTDVL